MISPLEKSQAAGAKSADRGVPVSLSGFSAAGIHASLATVGRSAGGTFPLLALTRLLWALNGHQRPCHVPPPPAISPAACTSDQATVMWPQRVDDERPQHGGPARS